MNEIRYSIIITCFNQREFIVDAVQSALLQPYPNKEVIVIDDGSTDGSADALLEYGESISLVQLQRNCGAIEARNAGVQAARGTYLLFLDGDDLLAPWALAVYDRLIAATNPRIILGLSRWFIGTLPKIDVEQPPAAVRFVEYPFFMAKDRTCGLSASTFVVQRELFVRAGMWSSGIFHLDLVDVLAKLGVSGSTAQILSPETACYRYHSRNSILDTAPFLDAAHRLIQKERDGKYPGGSEHRRQRYAWLGGILVFWIRRATREKRYGDALKLAMKGWSMIMAAVLQRSRSFVEGRYPVQTIRLHARGQVSEPASTGQVPNPGLRHVG